MSETAQASARTTFGVVSAFSLAFGGGLAGSVAAAAGLPVLASGSIFVACAATLMLARVTMKTWATLTAVFCLFHLIYGLAGPVGTLAGSELPSLFNVPYETSAFLFNVALATMGLALGLLVARPLDGLGVVIQRPLRIPLQSMLVIACIGASAASIMEIINAIRAGGVTTLVLGKSEYQSAVSGITLKLPAYELGLLCVALLGLARAQAKVEGRVLSPRFQVSVVVGLIPLVLISIFLGRRGLLLGWVFAYLLAAWQFRPVRRIGWKILLVLGATYFAMSLLFANRAGLSAAALTGNWSYAEESLLDGSRLASALNPMTSEFGAAFGNFSEVVHRGVPPRLLGESYVNGLALPVPSWLYPRAKPTQIGFVFRNRYFPELRDQGEIAGTAFSSVLEAYLNFGSVGVLIVYLVVGMILASMERIKGRVGSLWAILAYVYLIPVAIEWHRGEFSIAVSYVVFGVLYGGAMTLAVRIVGWRPALQGGG